MRIPVPLHQPEIALLNQGTSGKKGYITQAVFAGIALVLTVILAVVGVMVLMMGVYGVAFAGALASLIAFVIVAIRRK